jgi:hypothetical protein
LWSLLDLYKRRNQIFFPVYQREEIWFEDRKKLLIDSIFRGIDIPKLYLQLNDDGNWDCIDGHQRISAILGFFDGEFEYEGQTFEELSNDKKLYFEQYKLTIAEVTEIPEEEVRLLFSRLQLGIPLNSGEKLNAMKSNMGSFVSVMAKHPFIKQISIPIRRFAKEQVCAQICNNSLFRVRKGEFRNSKYEDLENLYRAFADFDLDSDDAKRITSVLDKLHEIFGIQSYEITNRASAVSIYLLVEEMFINSTLIGKENDIRDFYLNFLEALKKETRLGIDATNRYLLAYQTRIMQAADTKPAINERHERLKEAFSYFENTHKIIGYD